MKNRYFALTYKGNSIDIKVKEDFGKISIFTMVKTNKGTTTYKYTNNGFQCKSRRGKKEGRTKLKRLMKN